MSAKEVVLIKHNRMTLAITVMPGDTLAVLLPMPDGTEALQVATFRFDGAGVEVEVHSDDAEWSST